MSRCLPSIVCVVHNPDKSITQRSVIALGCVTSPMHVIDTHEVSRLVGSRELKQPRRGKNNVNVARHVCHVRKNGPDFPRMAYHMSLSEAFFRWDPKQTSVGPALPYGEQAMRCVVAGRKERRWGWPRCGADGWKTAGGVGGRPVGWDERDPSRSRRCMMTYCSCFAGGHISNSEGKSDHLGAPQPGRS